MFDKLVESAKQKPGCRAGRFFLVTGVIYAVALVAFGVATIIGFKPVLAEDYVAVILPRPLMSSEPAPKPQIRQTNPRPAQVQRFVAPDKVREIPKTDELKDLVVELKRPRLVVDDAAYDPRIGRDSGKRDGSDTKDVIPPKPPPPPIEKKTEKPSTGQQTVRLTSQITQGRAIQKTQPAYPEIAKRIKASGPVQIQIAISETGEVTDATVLSGHWALREVSLQAARQWRFKPTELNGRPVRAIGVITFNFILN